MSKVRPLRVSFGLEDMEDGDEGRVLTAVFPNFVHVASYNPCAGYDKERLAYKLRFEKRLNQHLSRVRVLYPHKNVVWLADANTAPTDADYNERAFDQVRHRRADAELKSGGSVDHPGCSKVERDSYKSVCGSFDGVNVWESLNPGKRGGSSHYTWSAGDDKYASRGIG